MLKNVKNSSMCAFKRIFAIESYEWLATVDLLKYHTCEASRKLKSHNSWSITWQKRTVWLVSWVAKITCFAQIGLSLKQFSKTFQFFLASCSHTLSCPPLPLPKPSLSLTKPQFSSSIFKKWNEFFSYFQYISSF